ncbi:MAG: hypothetical protein OEW11_05090 [Nitrospirota bacterium]|nr:hypothetical protein [Nitrospirota bacterium]
MTGAELVTLTVVRWFHLLGAAVLVGMMIYHALILGFRVNKVSGPVSPLLKKMSRYFGPVYWAAIVLLVTTGGFTILDRLTSLEGRAVPFKNMYEFFWGVKIVLVLVIIGNSLFMTGQLKKIAAAVRAMGPEGSPQALAAAPGAKVFRMRATVASLRVFNLVLGILVLMMAALLQNTFTLIVLRMEHY